MENQIRLPETIEEIMIIQPNGVTFGEYDLSEIQENVLTLIIDAIQQHMTKEVSLPKDLFKQPYVTIACDEAGGRNSKARVKQAIKDMRKKEFTFDWVDPTIHRTIETSGAIVGSGHDIKGTNKIIININPWAIPFLIYYGKGVGATIFDKLLALKVKGKYTKRLYPMLCRWQDKTSFEKSIKEIRQKLKIPETYSNNKIEVEVLKKSLASLKEQNSPIWFDYEMYCKYPKPGRKPENDTIKFHIKTNKPKETGGEQYEIYTYVYRWITWCFNTSSSKPVDIADNLSNMGVLKDVYDRAIYYDDKICEGSMTKDHAVNSLKKMLREEYKIK